MAQSEETVERAEEREGVERTARGEIGERGQERQTREEKEGPDKHRKSGWDPKWCEIPRFKSFLYNTSNGEFQKHFQSVLPSIL